jgi:hypothetical protein
MRVRLGLIVVAVLVMGAFACGGDDDEPASSSAPPTTAASGTTAPPSDTTDPTDTADTTSSTEPPIPPPTPPPGQPAACDLLDESALEGVGMPAGTAGVGIDQPNGVPAPSNGCGWSGDGAVFVALYYGMDPLEVLATARQLTPNGVDVAGIGQDGYFVTGTLFVDTGSQAFIVSSPGLTQDQLVTLAQNAISNL